MTTKGVVRPAVSSKLTENMKNRGCRISGSRGENRRTKNQKDAEGFESHSGWEKHLRPYYFLIAGIATTSDNAAMLPYNCSYYLRAPHLLRVGRPIGLPRIGRVPQCARFTHFGGWYVLRRIIASFYGTRLLRSFSVADQLDYE